MPAQEAAEAGPAAIAVAASSAETARHPLPPKQTEEPAGTALNRVDADPARTPTCSPASTALAHGDASHGIVYVRPGKRSGAGSLHAEPATVASPLAFFALPGMVRGVTFSADGRYLACVGGGGWHQGFVHIYAVLAQLEFALVASWASKPHMITSLPFFSLQLEMCFAIESQHLCAQPKTNIV